MGIVCQHSGPCQPRLLALVETILDGAAALAATTANDARRLALALHDERHPEAMVALQVALDLDEIAASAHRAAESTAESAGMGVAQ